MKYYLKFWIICYLFILHIYKIRSKCIMAENISTGNTFSFCIPFCFIQNELLNFPPWRLLKPDVIPTIFSYIIKVTNKRQVSEKREELAKKKQVNNKLFFLKNKFKRKPYNGIPIMEFAFIKTECWRAATSPKVILQDFDWVWDKFSNDF